MAEEASLGVARLRQAITNQATCGSQFELSIDSADKLCREIEDELENLSWDEGVQRKLLQVLHLEPREGPVVLRRCRWLT